MGCCMQERYQVTPNLTWIDITQPSLGELEHLAIEFDLHPTSVQDCLDSEHLPKYERIGSYNFVISRSYDENAEPEADSIQEITRKVAIFFNEKIIITIHRRPLTFLDQVRHEFLTLRSEPALSSSIVSEILRRSVDTYEKPIDQSLNDLEKLELQIFESSGTSKKQNSFEFRSGYVIKRKASVFKRMLRLTIDIVIKLQHDVTCNTPYLQNVKEEAEGLFFYSDELLDGVNTLLNLQISLSQQKTTEASHETNEVMRVLTIFSVFVLPLNVITGVYGMNFENMPELKWSLGYPMVLGSMVGTTLVIYLFFRRKGWLR